MICDFKMGEIVCERDEKKNQAIKIMAPHILQIFH